MTRTERIKLLAQSIGADIKAILAKTNLLKTAAYRDIGTLPGSVPEFASVNGVAGFGYGGLVRNLPSTTDLNSLNKVTADYSGLLKPINFPPNVDLFGAYTLSVIAGDSGAFQKLTSAKYVSSTERDLVVVSRFYALGKWTPWVAIYPAVVSPTSAVEVDFTVLKSTDDLNDVRGAGHYTGTVQRPINFPYDDHIYDPWFMTNVSQKNTVLQEVLVPVYNADNNLTYARYFRTYVGFFWSAWDKYYDPTI